jgi:hypothetical protein
MDVSLGAYGEVGRGMRAVGVEPEGDKVYKMSVVELRTGSTWCAIAHNHAVSVGVGDYGGSLRYRRRRVGILRRFDISYIVRGAIGMICRRRSRASQRRVEGRG